ncbi:hypothetical protein SPONN_1576 [uncultured Candidatus Thioglobus sp.]|nr:hypothetical protein SPONN_1576 [uncultured Candidatus Thioglobus sp.]
MDEAIDWYNGQLIELGSQFKQVVLKQIQGIAENPSWFLRESEGIYKAYILKFPYKSFIFV